MKKFYLAAVFVSALIGGIASSSSFDIRGRIDNYIHRDCARWGDDTPQQLHFTFEESRKFFGKKIISKNPKFKYRQIGRVVTIRMIASNRFFLEVYWGKGAEDENSQLIFIDKNWFEKDFKVLD